jgi:signal transduction histidine kinase
MRIRAAAPLAVAALLLATTLAAYAFLRPFDAAFMPHGTCYLWSPGVLWTNAAADAIIAASYLGIAAALAYVVFANREHIPFHWVVVAFGTFILACGATHIMEVVTLWFPAYWLSTAIKLITATVLAITAASLPFVLPRVTAAIVKARLADANQGSITAQRDEAIGASHLKSEYVATMSHELRTPLNAIIGMAELLGTTALDERQRTYAKTIDVSAEALLAVISSILDFSKIEAGKIDLEKRVFRLESLVEAAAAVLAQEVRQKGLTFHTFVDPMIPSVLRGDAGRLRQILLNLAGNAVKFTTKGCVIVRVRPVATTSQYVTVRFEVQDTGLGISADVIPQLFNPFVQAAPSSSRAGTGLGLSISKRLVELMHGEIGVTGEPGVGSLFWFTARFGQSRVKGSARRIVGASALLVSQDDVFHEIVARYVSAWGLPNRSLKTAAEAIAALDSERRDAAGDWIVIADADTVDVNAIGGAVAGIAAARVRMLRVGRDEALSKPMSPAKLFGRIAESLSGAAEPSLDDWDGVERRTGSVRRWQQGHDDMEEPGRY